METVKRTRKRVRRRNYRRIYQNHLNYELPQNFDVHHIDHNFKNNKIGNLVAIPKTLHDEYHRCFNIKDEEMVNNLKIIILNYKKRQKLYRTL